MSKTVDQRVVEMRFDNKDFEANVKTSMSTLEKLKKALKLDGVAKGLDEVSSASKKVNFSGLTNGIETVNARFSAMQVVGMTALSNITTAAMQAGKNLVNSFTFKPITDGFHEYELQMNSVQTILANTASKGTTIDDVTKALDELNTYADQTIYNFSEMTKNIGTFTAAGVDLDKATAAIKGIANLGAMSGSTATQVSTAMYQLSQALAAGKVSLMDWNSVVNAGMGGEQFQNALKRTAEHFGTDVDAMIAKYGSFRDSLTKGQWLTADVLTETLNQIGGAYDENALKAQGWSDAEIAAILQMSKTATDAATKVKTFTQLMDTLAEAAGSGWAKTWQIMFGDFEEAKSFFTDLSNYLGNIINAVSNARNDLLGKAFNSKWSDFTAELDKAGVSVDDYTTKLREVAKEHGNTVEEMLADGKSWDQIVSQGVISSDMFVEALKRMDTSSQTAGQSTEDLTAYLQKFQGVVHDVWMGNYGNVDTGRIERLTAAGWDYAEVQALVNKTVNDRRLDLEDLTDAQLKSAGYTQKEIDALHTLAGAAEDANSPIGQLIQKLERPSGRVLFLDSLQNILKAIIEPLKAVAKAFGEVFAVDPEGLYDAIAAFNRFSKSIVASEDTLENITSIFKGLFGVFKIFTTLAGGAFSIAFQGLTLLLENFDINVLDLAAAIGELVYSFSNWLTSGEALSDLLSLLTSLFGSALKPVLNFFSAFLNIGIISKAKDSLGEFFSNLATNIRNLSKQKPGDIIKNVFESIKNAFDDFKSYVKDISWEDVLKALSNFGTKVRETFTKVVDDMKEIGPNIIKGLQNGLKDGVDDVVEFMKNLASKLVEAVKALLGIHSPSTVFFDIGKNIIEGLCNGIKYFSSKVTDTLSSVIEDIKTLMSGIDWGSIMMVGAGIGTFIVFYQLTDALQTFATGVKQFSAPFQSAANIMNTMDKFLTNLTEGNSSNKGFANIAQGIKLIAESIAILVGSVALLTALDTGKMWIAIGAIAALAAIIGVLAAALNHFANGGTVLQSLQLNSTLMSLAGAFLLLSISAKIIGGMEWEDLEKAGAALAAFTGAIASLVLISALGKDVDNVAKVLSKIGAAFLLLSVSAKLLGTMSEGEMDNATTMIAVFVGAVSALVLISQFSEKIDTTSKVLAKIGTAFLLLGITAKLLGGMTADEMDKATSMIAVFVGAVTALVLVNQFSNKIDNTSNVLAKIGTAFLLLAITAKLIATMSWGDMGKAAVGLAGLTGIVALLVLITNLAPPGEIAKISMTLLAMSASIAILAGVAALLGMVKTENIVKGIAAVGALVGLMSVMMLASTGVPEGAKDTFVGMAVAIGVLAASVAVLSFIDPSKLATATAAMSALMAMLALVAKSASGIDNSMGSLIAISVAIGLIGAALYLLAGLPSESVLSSALSLSSVLIALAAACRILDGIGKISPSAYAAIGVLTLVMVGLAAIFTVMSSLGVEASLPNAIALSTVLVAMSAACAILGTITQVSTTAMGAMGILTAIMAGLAIIFGLMSAFNVQVSLANAISLSLVLNAMAAACLILSNAKTIAPDALIAMGVLTVIVGLLGGIFALLNQFDLSMSLETALSLSTVLIAMSVATGILGAIGPVASMALAGASGLATVLGVIAGVIAIAGGLKQIPGFDWLISEGATVLQEIGGAIGGFVGSFVGGAIESASDSLPAIGTNLSSFMTNLQPFLDGLNTIDPSKAEALQSLATAMLSFTGSGLIDQLTSFFSGESAVDTITDKLVPFGKALVEYSQAVSGIDAASIEASATAGKALSELANNLPKEGGLAQAIFGENQDFATFGAQMVAFGTAIKAYSVAIAGIDTASIEASATAGKALSELANNLPKEGGLAQAIFGENQDLAGFGTQLVLFGMGLKAYSTAVSGLDVGSIQNSVAAGQALSDLQNGLGSDGGVISFFTGGDMNLGDFANNLTSFGNALLQYSNKVSGIDVGQITSSTSAVRSIVNMLRSNADASDAISSGVDSINKIKDVGSALSGYYNSISGIDTGAISSVNSSIQRLISVINSMVGLDTSGIATFKSALNELATIDVNAVVSAFQDAANRLSGVGTNMMTNLASGIRGGSGTVTGAAQTVVLSMAQIIASTYPAFVTGGRTISNSIAQGVASGSSSISTSITSVIASAASSLRGYYTSFYNAGAYISQGLAAGMRSQLGSVRTAATEMANLAAQATRAAAQVHSPSRIFKKIGAYMGEGLVIGLDSYQQATYKSAYAVGDLAVDGLNLAVTKMNALLDSDMDVTPTITPVIDLTNVRNGVNSINSMISGVTPLNVIGEVGSISQAMNLQNQNGVMDDVVKAVNKLGTKLEELPRNQTVIDGITYDDGSNVSNAVADLVRAVRIEGRV